MSQPYTPIIDDFNRASLGGNYTAMFGALQITSNQLAQSGTGGIVVYNVANFGAPSEIYVSCPVVGAVNGNLVGIYTRASGAAFASFNAYNAIVETATTNDIYRISRIVNGVENVIVSTTSFGKAQNNDGLWFRSNGSNHKFFRLRSGVWTELLDTTDANITGAGRLGIGIISAAARVDDFGGGTIYPIPVIQQHLLMQGVR